jgi:hypothetical protein
LIISMQEGEKLSREQIRAFLEASEEVHCEGKRRREVDEWIYTAVASAGLSNARQGGARMAAALCGEDDRTEPGRR